MDINKIIDELRLEREQLDEAILSLSVSRSGEQGVEAAHRPGVGASGASIVALARAGDRQ